MYVWLILTMGISYAIPALQLVLKYQEETDETGNQDICYFNYQCSFPLGALSDFNHFLSNIGYVGSGLAFLIVTKYKSWKYRVNQLTNVIETETGSYIMHKVDVFGLFYIKFNVQGIPQQFGIFYAMGVALMFEGVLSACYHICPTNENFQFDTTFMY